ncbi:MAG: hypothetical protein SFT92_09910 [Rickettsiales bacterium]|nr:hypothetical protein [Rickettsiales bacterium]
MRFARDQQTPEDIALASQLRANRGEIEAANATLNGDGHVMSLPSAVLAQVNKEKSVLANSGLRPSDTNATNTVAIAAPQESRNTGIA